jgi:nucleotide-binding universal stress UspA family protein
MPNATQEIAGKDEMPAAVRQPSHIILATDFSARCDRAQARAVQLAVQWNASLTAVHALSDTSLTDDTAVRDAYRTAATRNADLLREELACTEGLRSSVTVEEGPVEAVILHAVQRERAELIVTGIARTGLLTQVLIGSTATALARTSPVPLLVVKKKVLETEGRAAVATDLSDSSKPALMVALRWFSFRHLALFHAFGTPYRGLVDDKSGYDSGLQKAAEDNCRDFFKEVTGADASDDFDIIASRGDPVAGLQVLTNQAGIDLVIAGTHGRTGILHAFLGSVASRILDGVPSDVLVVPSRPR